MGRLVVLALVVCGCAKEPVSPNAPAKAPDPGVSRGDVPAGKERAITSMDGRATLTLTESNGACTARCVPERGETWESPTCLAGPGDVVFIANDCSAAIVVVAQPKGNLPWDSTNVIFTYDHARRVHAYKGGPLLDSPRREGDHFEWVKGEPRYLRSGAGIEVQTLSGRPTRLPFHEGAAINEETLVNDRPETPDPPRPVGRPSYDAPPRIAPPPPHAMETDDGPAPQPSVPSSGRVRRWGAPPTIKPDQAGDPLVCRNEGEPCGTGADCCGRLCKGGVCQQSPP